MTNDYFGQPKTTARVDSNTLACAVHLPIICLLKNDFFNGKLHNYSQRMFN